MPNRAPPQSTNPTAKSSEDRRELMRRPMTLGVRFSTTKDLANAVRASTLNMSMGGLCLLTQKEYEVGAELQLVIELGDQDLIEVTVVVAWSRPGKAIGLRFTDLADEHREMLAALVAKGANPKTA